MPRGPRDNVRSAVGVVRPIATAGRKARFLFCTSSGRRAHPERLTPPGRQSLPRPRPSSGCARSPRTTTSGTRSPMSRADTPISRSTAHRRLKAGPLNEESPDPSRRSTRPQLGMISPRNRYPMATGRWSTGTLTVVSLGSAGKAGPQRTRRGLDSSDGARHEFLRNSAMRARIMPVPQGTRTLQMKSTGPQRRDCLDWSAGCGPKAADRDPSWPQRLQRWFRLAGPLEERVFDILGRILAAGPGCACAQVSEVSIAPSARSARRLPAVPVEGAE